MLGRLAWVALGAGVLLFLPLTWWMWRSSRSGGTSGGDTGVGPIVTTTAETPGGFNWQYAAARRWLQSNEPARAIPFLQQAARSGHVESMLELGLAYYWGRGVLQNFDQAVALFQQAARRGNAEAQYLLWKCHQLGQGVAQDFVAAYAWFNLASARGHAAAGQSRQELTRLLSPEDVVRGQQLSLQLEKDLLTAAPPPEPTPSPR